MGKLLANAKQSFDFLLHFFLFKAKFQSQPWLWASEESVHEGDGRPAVSAEPAYQNSKEMRGGCEGGGLLPVRISRLKLTFFVFYLLK